MYVINKKIAIFKRLKNSTKRDRKYHIMSDKKIRSALISVYGKDGLDEIASSLHKLGVRIFSTGGTYSYITGQGIPAEKVEDLTTYPSILGGRVKTLHPSVFGGILARRENSEDLRQLSVNSASPGPFPRTRRNEPKLSPAASAATAAFACSNTSISLCSSFICSE